MNYYAVNFVLKKYDPFEKPLRTLKATLEEMWLYYEDADGLIHQQYEDIEIEEENNEEMEDNPNDQAGTLLYISNSIKSVHMHVI